MMARVTKAVTILFFFHFRMRKTGISVTNNTHELLKGQFALSC